MRLTVAAVLLLVTACKREVTAVLLPPPKDLSPVVDVDAGEVTIAAAGDISDSELGGQVQTAALIADGGYDAVLLLGDDQYPAGSLSDYQRYFEPTWGRFFEKLHPAPGNHEYLLSNARGYFDYFGPRAGERGKGWYSFDLGAWHLIALNTSNGCRAVGCGADSEQVKWLREDLAQHRNRCVLAYWHHPRFCSGIAHGDFEGADVIWRTLQQYGADVVLNGHEHLYERFEPILGLREFVVGTGGVSHYSVKPLKSTHSQLVNTDSFGVLSMTLKPGGYDWRFVPVPGSTFTDTGSDTCH
ncbi:MAG: metallophosphoesterase [Archangiaceae bacterium]|nr:metallophosphoesterase [Archangiaceae bacterium]